MPCALNTIIHQTRADVLHEEGTTQPYSDFLDAMKYQTWLRLHTFHVFYNKKNWADLTANWSHENWSRDKLISWELILWGCDTKSLETKSFLFFYLWCFTLAHFHPGLWVVMLKRSPCSSMLSVAKLIIAYIVLNLILSVNQYCARQCMKSYFSTINRF